MARKSGSTILQEELYPPSAASARPGLHGLNGQSLNGHDLEMDDARLVDLDVDEESPFLRGQKRVSARRSSLPKKTANRLLWGIAAAAVVCFAALCAAALYHYGEHSWRFRVESSDNIQVAGMQNVTKSQIMEVMGADIGRNIFFIPLAQQKAQLEQIPWVESASVMRFVPNRLQVEIHERTPVAFARVGPRMLLIDAGGTLMELSPKHKYSFPVIIGMNPGEPLSTRTPRMKAYTQMVHELDSGGARYAQDLSEVDLSDLEDVKVRVNDPAGDVQVHLGSSDYLRRYKIFVSHAQGWRQQFQKLESVDLRYDNQIIVNPDMEKSAPSKQSIAKAQAAGRVKPVSLLTRVGRNDRPVPRPAFELTAKKLDPKAATPSTKTASTKRVGTPANPGKTTTVSPNPAVAKKSIVAAKPVTGSPAKKRVMPLAARRKIEHKRTPNGAITAKSAGHTGPRKASPAIAKTQANSEPSD